MWGHEGAVTSLAVWKDHTTGHDRIATAAAEGAVKVWDGEALTLLHNLECYPSGGLLAFKTVEGPHRLLVGLEGGPIQVWDPEEGRLLDESIHRGCPVSGDPHLFESARGRHLVAFMSRGDHHARHPGDTERTFLDVCDLGEAPAPEKHVRPAHHHG
jgi:WD40 repeat protein